MIHQHSTHAHRMIGCLDHDKDLIGALEALCAEVDTQAAEVRVSGALSAVILGRFSPKTREYEPVFEHHGAVEIVHLRGHVAMMGDRTILRLDGLFSVDAPNGPQLVSGQVIEATAEVCEFVIDQFKDVKMAWGMDQATGRVVLESIDAVAVTPKQGSLLDTPQPKAQPKPEPKRELQPRPAARPEPKPQARPEPKPEPAPKAESKPKASMSWSQVGEVTEQPEPKTVRQAPTMPTADEIYGDWEDDFPDIKPGDLLDHPKLGRCRVIKVENDEFAFIRLPRGGKTSKLVLDLFDIEFSGEEQGRSIFKLKMRR